MTNLYRFGGILAALLLSAGVYAGDIQVDNAWARATAPGQDAASLDMIITSKHAAILIAVSSPACKTVELHSMNMAPGNGMMQMREVESIPLPAGQPVNLGRSGYHLMLSGLKVPLKAGASVPLTLSIRIANDVVKFDTTAEVKPLSTAAPATEEQNTGGY